MNFGKEYERILKINDKTIKIGFESEDCFFTLKAYYIDINKIILSNQKLVDEYAFGEDLENKKYDLCNNVYIKFGRIITINQKDKNIHRIDYDFNISKDVIINKKKDIFGIRMEHYKEKSIDIDKEKMIFYQLK